jgi:hypothetical protein
MVAGVAAERKRVTLAAAALCLAALLALAGPYSAAGGESGILAGVVLDVSRNPVAGASVFVYSSPNTRRPADYISRATDGTGAFRITLPAGRYWTVALVRQGVEQYGPLLPGDRHSGAPLETDVRSGETVEEEYIVRDLRETSLLDAKLDTSYLRVEGRLLTGEGEPAANGYAFARREKDGGGIPDYVSTWTDAGGGYTLFLPAGAYWLGSSRTFPPDADTVPLLRVVVIDGPIKDVDILMQE